jgi:sugar/nucleoside kinase (ribokinase family)
VDGRKHVVVTLGAGGVLWLSAPPQASHGLADLLLALPFFRAAALPALRFDFRHVPAPRPARVAAAAAGAGDALAGAMAASLARGGGGGGGGGLAMPRALRAGLAAARIAVEAEGGEGAAAWPRLTWPAVLRGLDDVEAIDDAYEEVELGQPAPPRA